jgi:hypothetical protein
MSCLRELQSIYNEYYRGNDRDVHISALNQIPVTQSSTSYYKDGLPGVTPGQGQPSAPTTTIPDEAEDEDAHVVSRSVLRQEINNILETKGDKSLLEGMMELLIVIHKNSYIPR